MRKIIIAILIKILAFYYRIVNYIRVSNGYYIVSPSDVNVDTSLIWKSEIAPNGLVFYIAKIKYGRTFYSKNVCVNRKDLPPLQENMLKWRVQRIFANSITEIVNKKK